MIDKIKHTGEAAERVARGLQGVDCSATLPGGDAGMPGARSVPKLAAVIEAWRGRERGFVGTLDEHSVNMAKAVRLYSGNEEVAAHDLSVKVSTTAGPRPS
ncbi:hypothetical protein AB5J62_16280 [Amycolatopsis sp. cg5]|uniref:hypothetical protein n=1 Tax=Amycolatopsis sp. cg5 TaxID=3238802 RepID=UPI003523EC55